MDDEESLLPTSSKKPHYWIRIKFQQFAVVTVGLPLAAFIFCVYWSTVYNFRESTATHCQVDNYLPSVSAAIGSFSPQKHIWMVFITIHFLPRIKIAGLYYKYFRSVIDQRSYWLVPIVRYLNVIEVTCLLGLTLVSSTDFYPAHAFFFVTFVITSIFYMILSCHLLKNRRAQISSNMENRSLRLKLMLAAINFAGFLSAGFFFVRHNTYCEPGMYSLFALLEYVVVLSNMGFHMTAYYDFYGKVVSLSSKGLHFS